MTRMEPQRILRKLSSQKSKKANDLVAGAAPLLQCTCYGLGHTNLQLHAADVVMSGTIALQKAQSCR